MIDRSNARYLLVALGLVLTLFGGNRVFPAEPSAFYFTWISEALLDMYREKAEKKETEEMNLVIRLPNT